MTKTSLIGLFALLALVPFACGDDEATTTSTTASTSATNAASTNTASSSQSAGGSGGTTAVGGMGGMGEGGGTSGDDCETCLDPLVDGQGACSADVDACLNDATCEMWADCYDECFNNDFTATCFSACDTMYPGASNLYTPLVTCICGGCSADCAPVCS